MTSGTNRVLRALVLTVVFSSILLTAAAAATRVALVVGVGRYDFAADLPNARNDAQVMAGALQARGFNVTLVLDPTRREMLVALAKLRLMAKDATLVAVYFSGHGAQVGTNPVVFLRDSRIASVGPGEAPIGLQTLVKAIAEKPRQKLLLIDACRTVEGREETDGPSTGSLSVAGLQIEFASQYGAPAFDGVDQVGPFAAAWANALAGPETMLDALSRQARLSVIRSTGGVQVPWSQSSLLRPIDLGRASHPTE